MDGYLVITADIQQTYIQSALARAAADRQDGRIPSRQANGTYSVPSSTTPDTTYTVVIRNLTQLQASCTCAHGSKADARGVCRHAVAAMASEVRRLGGRYTVRTRKTAPKVAPVMVATDTRPDWIRKSFVR